MNNDPIETEGEPVATPHAIARRDDAPALRELVGRMYQHLVHVEPCSPAKAHCTCGLERLMSLATYLGCREPVRVTGPATPSAQELAASHAAAGGFLGGLAGNLINGLIHGAPARQEARDAKKKKACEQKRAPGPGPAHPPADPRRLGPGKSSRR